MDANGPQDPTEVFNDVFDEAPTRVLHESGQAPLAPSGRGKGPIIALIVLGALLLIAAGVIVGLLVAGGGQGQPVPEPTTSETPEPEPEPEPAALAEIVFFEATQTTIECQDDKSGTTATVSLSWTVTDADQIALARGEAEVDALDEPSAAELAAEEEGFTGLPFDCTKTTQVYTLTAANIEDVRTSEIVTIERTLAPPPKAAAPKITEVAFTDGLDYAICPSFEFDLTVEKGVRWKSTPGVNSVSIHISYADPMDSSVFSDYKRLARNLPASGSYPLTIECGTSGYSTAFKIRVTAENESGTVRHVIEGNTAS